MNMSGTHGISGWQALCVIAICVVVMTLVVSLAPQ